MDFVQIKNQINEMKEQAKKMAQEAFNVGAQSLFENDTQLVSFSWKQYTPYFNDGDECVFSAETEEIYVNGVNEYGDTLEDNEQDINLDEWESLASPVKEFLAVFDDEDLKGLFGDHVQVIVTKEGIEKEEYDHD